MARQEEQLPELDPQEARQRIIYAPPPPRATDEELETAGLILYRPAEESAPDEEDQT